MEGQFFKMPNGQEGNHFVRKPDDLSEKKFENIKEDWEKRYIRDKSGEIRDDFEKFEIKMTPQQKEVLAFVIDEANRILDEYDVRGTRATPDNIRLVNDKFFEKIKQPQASGSYLPVLQTAVIRGNENLTNTALAENAFHELMHMFSFQRSVLEGGTKEGNADLKNERVGISITPKDDLKYKYFRQINEAITVELGMRFRKMMHGNKLFNEDIWKLERKLGKNRDHTVLQMKKGPDGELEPHSISAYPEEYGNTKATTKVIYEKNKDTFNSPEDVMEFFIKAYFSGKLLPIARLIEKTYGKGFFRKIGEESA